MRSRALVGAVFVMAVLVSALVPAGSADAAQVRHRAPYDVGCLGTRPPCPVSHEDARMGRLTSTVAPFVCVFYGPPFVFPCLHSVESSAGVHLRTSTYATVTLYARVRDISPVAVGGAFRPVACLGLSTLRGDGGAYGFGCKKLRTDRGVLLITRFELMQWDPDKYIAFVHTKGAPHRALVESIVTDVRTVKHPKF